MADSPLITFRAGRCTFEGRKVVPSPTPGYIYLFTDDDLLHFCWRPRSAPSTAPELDLIMFPQDGHFVPLLKEEPSSKTSGVLYPLAGNSKKGETGNLHSPTNGRIFVLRFNSSGQKHFFWMQSHSQHTDRDGSASWWSQRDQKIGRIVDDLLQGEDVDVESEIDKMSKGEWSEGGDDEDAMDVDRAGATGGDARHEGSGSREGGADGGRAPSQSQDQPQDTSELVSNLLNSLGGGGRFGSNQQQQQQLVDKPYTTLSDLLPPPTTIPYIAGASSEEIDHLCSYLPHDLFVLALEAEGGENDSLDSNDSTQDLDSMIKRLSINKKREICSRVLRSPQFQQSLASLTIALRDGGLPTISESLGLRDGTEDQSSLFRLHGGAAVEEFVKMIRKTAEAEGKGTDEK